MYTFPKEIIHPDDVARYAKKEYNDFNYYYGQKFNIVKKCNPKVIAEIGVRAGYSAYAFLSACPEARYYGFDNNDGKESGARDLRFYQNTEYILRKFPNIMLIYNDFNTQTVEKLPVPEGAFIHVDADHSYKGALHDLRLALKSKAKYILVDDVLYLKPVFHAVNDFLKETNLQAEYYPDFRGEILIYC